MAGSAAATAAAASAQAATVQITQVNNFVSDSQNSLKADFTGDAQNDAVLSTSRNSSYTTSSFNSGRRYYTFRDYANLFVNSGGGGRANRRYSSSRYTAGSTFITARTNFFVTAGTGVYYTYTYGTGSQSVNGLVAITFTDSRINGGGVTTGFLDIRAFNQNVSDQVVQIVRLVFDDATTTGPTGVVPGGSNTVWTPPVTPPTTTPTTPTDPNAALKVSLNSKIKKLNKKAKKAKSSGNSGKAKKLKAKIKKLKKKLKAL